MTDASYQYDAAGRLAQQSLAINPYVMELSGSGSQSALDLKLDNAYGTDGTLSATQIRAATRVVTTPTFPPQNGIGQDVVSQQSVLLRYSYDALQRPSSVELSSGGSGGSLITTEYAYLPGSAAERTTPLITSLNTSVKGHPAVTLEYSYDALGNITKISGRTLSGSDTASYRYDAQSQLTGETLSDRSYVYTYDTAGNILSKKETRGGTTTTHTYTYGNSQWKDLLTKYDGVTVTYDAIGNPLKYRGMTFTWANGRELRSAKAGGAYMLYTYGADGLRTQKIVGANEIHSYGWSGGRLVYERMGTSAYSTMGTGSTQGTQGAQKVLTPPAASAYDRTLYFLYDAGGSPIGFILREGSGLPKTYYYVKNLQGDVLGIIDGGGNVKAAYRYNAWGELLSATGELAELNPIRYRGYYYDSETGLYYLQSRYYDPVVGRFLNTDASSNLAANGAFISYNLFSYCLNNPLKYADPNGEIAITTLILIGSAVIALIAAGVTAYNSYQYTGQIDWANTITAGLSWFSLAYTLGMSAYCVYLSYCDYKGLAPVTEVNFNANASISSGNSMSVDIFFNERTLQHEFKHANDYGIIGSWNKANKEAFQQAIQN